MVKWHRLIQNTNDIGMINRCHAWQADIMVMKNIIQYRTQMEPIICRYDTKNSCQMQSLRPNIGGGS